MNIKKIVSLLLALAMVFGMVPPSQVYAGGNSEEFVEADYEVKNVDGKSYKVYKFTDLFGTSEINEQFEADGLDGLEISEPRIMQTVGAPNPALGDEINLSVDVQWTTYDLAPGDLGTPVFFQILDSSTNKIIAQTENIMIKAVSKSYKFHKLPAWNDPGVSHSVENWEMSVPNEYKFDVRLRTQHRGDATTSNLRALISQRANPLYRAEYYTNKTNPKITVNRTNVDDETDEVPVNDNNLNANGYYSWAKAISGGVQQYYEGVTLDIQKYGSDTLDSLQVSDYITSGRTRMRMKAPGMTDFDRGPGTFTDNGTPYHYEVTGDHIKAHIFTIRQDLTVKFDPNGGTWVGTAPADQTIGHSMKLGDSWAGLGPINVPTAAELTPPAPTGTEKEKEFIGWNTDANATSALFTDNTYAQPITDDVTTFYAIYKEKAQGKVTLEYVDASGTAIVDKYKITGQSYPTEKGGNIGETVGTDVASTAAAPKFLGYEVTGVGVTPAAGQTTATYTDPATATVTYKYKKLADIIPDKTDNGTDNPDATPDVKATYKKVTIKVDSAKGKFQKGNADVTGSEFLYYVNPVEGKTLQNVLDESGLTPVALDENKAKIDDQNKWKFDPKQTEATPTVPAADFALTTVVGKDNVKDTGVVMEVNFKQTTADKFKDKLQPVDIRVWVDTTDTDGKKVPWKTGVKLKGANEDLQKILDKTETTVTDESSRNSATANLPNGSKGDLKVTFEDGSSLVVNDQTLYVSPLKVKVEPGTDETKLPDKKIKVELKLGEGVKVGDTNGDKTNPAVHSTFYIKPNTGLAADDFPTLDVQSGYKTGTGKWDKDKTTVFPGRLKSDNKTYEDESFLASATKLGEGSVNVEYYADGTKIDDISAYKLDGKTYITSKQGTEDVEVKATDLTGDYHDLIGYEKDTTQGTNGIEIPADAKYETETANIKTVKFHYKKIDDIVVKKPGDTKPAGYLTVTFKTADANKGKLWLKTAAQATEPTDNTGLVEELVYYVNPINATLDLDANKLSGKKANGAEEINVEVYAKVTDGKSKVKLDKNSKYVWDKNPADAIDSNKKVKKDVTLTVQYEGIKIAEIIKKENLAPVTLKVWVGDTIPWKDGVKVADTVTDETLKTTIEGYLKDKKTSYKDNTTPERTSKEEAVNEPRTGTIRVTFSDKSYIDVEKQDLYVIPHVTAATNDKAPKDAIEVTFMLGEGVKAGTKTGAETAVEYAKYKVKPSTNLDTYKLGTGKTIFENINAEVTDATKYTGVVWEGQTAKKPEDHVVTNSNKVFTAKAAKIFKVKHVFKGIDADKDDTPEIAANELPEELKAGANSLIPADKTLEEKKSYTPSNIDTKVTQTIKNAQDEVTMVYEWTFKEWKPNKIENISKTETVTGIWERRQATSDKPTVDQPKAEDTVIKGKGKKGSTIVVTTPDGKTHKTTVGDNGDWSVTVPPVKENDKIKVTQEEKGKKPSEEVTVTVDRKIKYFGHFYEPSPDYLNKNVPAKKEEKVQEKYLEAYRWYVKGNDMGMFMPKKGITRAEVAQMFARALEYDKAMINVNITPYTDVDANAWYYEAVQKTSAAGIFKGSDKGTFMPTREITKAELIATIARFQHLSTKAGNTLNLQANHWATAEVEAAYQEGWLDIYTNGTAQFAADEVISREEVVTILNRAFGRIADTKYIDDNAHTMTNFPDATKDMWSYYEIMTAANTYLVDKMWVNHATKDNGPETLKEMIEWVKPLLDNKDVREVVEQVRFQR